MLTRLSSFFVLTLAVRADDWVAPIAARVLAAVRSEPVEVARLYGSIDEYAYYFMDILVGSPPQRQSVIVDTGSSLLGFPCSECRDNCGLHIDPAFNFSASSSAEWSRIDSSPYAASRRCDRRSSQRCGYTQRYTEGSGISGDFFSDMVSIGDWSRGNPAVRFDWIGCHTSENNLFVTQKASGIMGLTLPKQKGTETVIEALFGERTNSRVFALCLGDNGGLFTVGGYNKTYHVSSDTKNADQFAEVRRGQEVRMAGEGDPDMTYPEVGWTPIIEESSYRVEVTAARFGRDAINSNFGRTLVDSGTTFSYFPPRVYEDMRGALQAVCRSQSICDLSSLCWRIQTPSDLDAIPSFYLTLRGGTVVEWSARSFLYQRPSKGDWCLGIDNNHHTSTILGATFMKNQNVIFDTETRLLGFVAADCPEYDDDLRPTYSPRRRQPRSKNISEENLPEAGAPPVRSATIPPPSVAPIVVVAATTSAEVRSSLWLVVGVVSGAIVLAMVLLVCQSTRNRGGPSYHFMGAAESPFAEAAGGVQLPRVTLEDDGSMDELDVENQLDEVVIDVEPRGIGAFVDDDL